MTHFRIIGLALALVASTLACATPNKYTPPDGGPDEGVEESSDASPPPVDLGKLPADTTLASDSPGVDTAPALADTAPAPADTAPPPSDGPCGTPTDPRNCGTCGHDCTKLPNVVAGAVSCVASKCVVSSNACISGYAHCSANVEDGCEADLSRAQTCGNCSTSCGTGKMCALSGQSYQCVSCGAVGQACCNGSACTNGNTCSNGICTAVCVPGTACGTNNMCTKSLISCATGSPVCVSMAINEGISCGATCAGSSAVESRCSGGACVAQAPKSCLYGCSGGSCNIDCPSGSNKTPTGCTPCGAGTDADPQPCCEKGTPCSGKRICCTGGLCGGSGDRCIPCGVVLHPCCGPQETDSRGGGPTTGTCDTDLICTDQGVYQQPPTALNSYLCDDPPP